MGRYKRTFKPKKTIASNRPALSLGDSMLLYMMALLKILEISTNTKKRSITAMKSKYHFKGTYLQNMCLKNKPSMQEDM